MSGLKYRVPSLRGANLIAANAERLESADGRRWACGRNVKVSLGNGRYDGVEVWKLKTRDATGKVIVVASDMDRKAAMGWVGAGRLS